MEFTTALRSLLGGLRLFYVEAVMPGDVELEVAIDECFRRIDSDRSNSLTLGELLVFAYRNRRWVIDGQDGAHIYISLT